MKHSTAEVIIGILLVTIAVIVIHIMMRQNDIIIEQAYISNQIGTIYLGNKEILERLNTPLELNVR